MYRGSGKGALGTIQLGGFPVSSYPGVVDRVGGFEARSDWAGWLNVAFDPVVFFGNTKFCEFCGIPPIKVFKIQGARGEGSSFVEVVNDSGRKVSVFTEELPAVVLEIS